MTDELALKYKELKENEAEEKEKKELKKEQAIKAVGNAVQTSILIVLGLFFLLAVLVETQDVDISSTPPTTHDKAKLRWEKQQQHIKRKTSAGVPIERGADIDYRIDSDKIINLSVRRIRSNGYRCNSLSSIKLYKYPERIVVECNEGRDKYWIQKDSAGLFMQVTRI